jgi:hypothetical protein
MRVYQRFFLFLRRQLEELGAALVRRYRFSPLPHRVRAQYYQIGQLESVRQF